MEILRYYTIPVKKELSLSSLATFTVEPPSCMATGLIAPRDLQVSVTQLFTRGEIVGKGAYGAGLYYIGIYVFG